MNPAFDTLKAVKDLTNAGADEKLAEATVATISTAINEQVATKADLKVVRADIKAMQEKLEHMVTKADLKTDLELLSKSMTIRLGLMLFAAFAAMVALFNATN